MGQNTKIEWCDHTFNPWIGCAKVSPGCANCYAAVSTPARVNGIEWGKGKPRVRTSESNWRQPVAWNKAARNNYQQVELSDGRVFRGTQKEIAALELPYAEIVGAGPARPRVFCASLADWLDDEAPIKALADLLYLIWETPSLDWLLLTKRPENFKRRLEAVLEHIEETADDGKFDELHLGILGWNASPGDAYRATPKNVWIGTTVENQEYADKRIPALLDIPAKVRFLSCEPLLGPLDLRVYPKGGSVMGEGEKIDWIICGGESGPHARPMHPDWARSLRDQCNQAGVPFFFKQWGEFKPLGRSDTTDVNEEATALPEKEWERCLWVNADGTTDADNCNGPDSYMMHKVGKKAAGRLLDGVEHNGLPKPEGSAAK